MGQTGLSKRYVLTIGVTVIAVGGIAGYFSFGDAEQYSLQVLSALIGIPASVLALRAWWEYYNERNSERTLENTSGVSSSNTRQEASNSYSAVVEQELSRIDEMKNNGIIDEEEYREMRQRVIRGN